MINKKHFFSIIISIAMLIISLAPIQAAELPVISVGQVSTQTGGSVRVPISISGNTGICGATLKVSYSERMVLTNVEKGEALASLAMTKPGSLSANPVKIVWDGTDADNSNGIIAYLTFSVPNEDGMFGINISYDEGDIVDGTLLPVKISLKNGSVTVGDGGQSYEPPEEDESFIIKADAVTSNSGGSIDVPIRIVNNTGVCGATITANYDNRLTLTKISKGEALSSLVMTKPGSLSVNPAKLVWDGTDADTSDGIIATLTFTVPDSAGQYNIALSYNDGDIVDGALMPIKPLLQNGYIQVGSAFAVSVTTAGSSVILEGQNNNGKILVAFYEGQGKLLELKTFDTASSINAGEVSGAVKAKVMWWNDLNGMKPECAQKIITINQ